MAIRKDKQPALRSELWKAYLQACIGQGEKGDFSFLLLNNVGVCHVIAWLGIIKKVDKSPPRKISLDRIMETQANKLLKKFHRLENRQKNLVNSF